MATKSAWIVEATPETFERDVVERSRQVPVVIDFWAPWCGPCRALGPILERLANEYQGKFILVKVDTQQWPQLADAFQIEGIPAVFALRDGELVDRFEGAMPEPQVRAWLERVLPNQAEALVAEARELEASAPQAAEAKYREALALSPNEVLAHVGLARTVLARGNVDEAREIIQELADAGALDAEGERLQADIAMRSQGQEAGTLEEARAAAAANPDDPALQLNLARALAAAGLHQEALEAALVVVQKDRRGLGEQARELMVQVFHLLGPDSEVAGEYRRKLATALY